MRLSKQNPQRTDLVDAPAEVTRAVSSTTVLTALVSLLALFMSGVSLYQTVLKQPSLHLFVPNTISYTRDPQGSYEVLVVPVTIANSGARDGIISSLKLMVRNENTKREREFQAMFVADQGYFSTKEDYNAGISRPKTAFAPVTVAGRTGYSGTVLFYPREFSRDRAVAKEGRFSLTLSAGMKTVEKIDMIDRFLGTEIAPVQFGATLKKVSRYFDGAMLTGKFVRLLVSEKMPGTSAK